MKWKSLFSAAFLTMFLPYLHFPALGLQDEERPEGRNIIRNGTLSEHPENAIHWVTRDSGNLGTFKILPPAKEGDSGILEVQVREISSRPWTLELRQAIAEEMHEGETLLIRFDYKLTPGYAFHCYWQKDAPPWSKFLSIRLSSPEDEWQTCAMSVRVHTHMQPRQTSLSFHLAEKTGTIQFRNFAAIVYPASVAPEDLETTVDPVFGGDFYDHDWRQGALARIDAVRKGQLQVKVTKEGEPLPQADIQIRQQERDFLIGTGIDPGLLHYMLNDDNETMLTNAAAELQDNAARIDKYKNKIMNPQLFNQFSPRDMFVWRIYEDWSEEKAPQIFAKLDDNYHTIHGRTLYTPAFRFFPPECRHMTAEDLRDKFYQHVRQVTRKYGNKIQQWDVLHAPLTYDEVYDHIGADSLVEVFKIAAEESPESELIFSDDRSLLTPAADHLNEMLSIISWLRGKGARIDAIALVAEMTRPYIAPQAIEERLDKIAQATNLPIYITALAVESPKEDIQADRLQDLFIAFYSHAAVKGVSLAGIWEAAMERPAAALFRKNFAIKPAGKIFEKLMTEDWWTNADLKSDTAGQAEIAAFFGKYEITVTHGEDTGTATFHLQKDKEAVVAIELK